MIDFYTGDMSTFELPKHYGDFNLSFRERKKKRTKFYIERIYKNKLIECTACSGYKYWCGYACGNCEGTGKQRQR